MSLVFRWLVWLRHLLYRVRFIFRDHHLGTLIICVGNLTMGGTGKTPVVEMLARALRDRGRQVAILSRGYKSARPKRRKFTLRQRLGAWWTHRPLPRPGPRVVSDGRSVLLDSRLAGDEPFMLAKNLPGVSVVVDKDRVKAGLHAIRELGADTLLLDDGFQYLRLRHRLDIVLVDATKPFGNGHLHPPRHLARTAAPPEAGQLHLHHPLRRHRTTPSSSPSSAATTASRKSSNAPTSRATSSMP